MRLPISLRHVLVCSAVALVCVACSSKDDQSTVAGSPTPAASAASAACRDRTLPTPTPLSTAPTTKPTIVVPDGPPPCKLVIQDIRVGDGPAATLDSTVTMQYVGVAWSTKQQFDASWDRGTPLVGPLSEFVKGWQQGIPGMKVGGRRELIIPPALGYGPGGSPPAIAGNETLIFVVDLLKVA